MIYIFHVDTGTTIIFDIKHAMQSVSDLKEAIERECGVASDHQVLLMSGGESLESSARVCSYAAGTDTNPIYLFSKAAIESESPPAPSLDYGSDIDLTSQIEASLAMPASYQTLVNRAQLAQQCCVLAREQARICERLVHDQHLMQQGWAAVVANLDDITNTFQSRSVQLQQNFADFLGERHHYVELLENFTGDLQILEKIPILPALRAHAEGLITPEEQQQEEATAVAAQVTEAIVTESEQITTEKEQTAVAVVTTEVVVATTENIEEASKNALNLLSWIAAKDNSLEQMAEQISRSLEQLNANFIEATKNEQHCAIEAAKKLEMREIKGLGERLFMLETLMAQVKKLLHEQSELAQGFQQNKTRVSNLNDPSVLPDLCTSHRQQLMVMLQNHNQLRDIRKRCTKAKEELSTTIHKRLKWIMHVENKMFDLDCKMVMYYDNLRRLRHGMKIFRQIHSAPQMYMSAITEVVRRRTFSQAFLVWANNLACQLMAVHGEELDRRRKFQTDFEGHFLSTLFPGMEDTPPTFATQAPSVFDSGLPKLTPEDMEALRLKLPDLASSVSAPDLNSITQFFFSKSVSESSSDGHKQKESMSMRVDPQPKEQGVRPPLISDRGGFESETDTEEFEKIGQAAMDSKMTSYESTKQQTSQTHQKQLEENLNNSREEVERLRAVIRSLKTVATDSLLALRRELTVLKEQALVDRAGATKLLEQIGEAVNLHTCALKEREHALTVDHELELSDLKKLLEERNEQLQNLKSNLIEKEAEGAEQDRLVKTIRQKFESEQQEMKKLQSIYRQVEDRLEQTRADKEKAMKETNEARILETTTLRSNLDQCQEKIRDLEEKLAAVELEHQKTIKEETEKLQLEYKNQLENMRGRFKLMAASTMERSPSDSSLEKIERVDVVEFLQHEALAQAFGAKRDEYKRALNDERMKMSQSNSELTESMKSMEKSEKDEFRVSESKKVRLEADSDVSGSFSNRLETLESDNKRLNSELRTVRESKEQMQNKLEALESERLQLEVQLFKTRTTRTMSTESMSSSSIAASTSDISREKDMNTSVSVMSVASSTNRADASTSTERTKREASSSHSVRDKLTKSTTSLMQKGKISFTSCSPGDVVLVLWDQQHRNYVLLQDSRTYYFLNSDCIAALDLQLSTDGLPQKLHAVAEVVDKEYCSARKPENRYRVPQGTRFFRVRVKPLQRHDASPSTQ